ncbi:ADP-glyceromanno-heptose 6-epimerase [Roseicyclus sp. F158]|uniref:ADP-glyceromanno-heptose 6-epimerase n=1 Tax=Tropicimonas omnivorans TaxID=3075590 RepID=A0ABU3DFI5_9RHOB|nr:ADP-glyceromanno-heptose 6-epimerase [Roseicyclus sp. F158]MDT0682471.1 ADP-glyceromanno-heptose 6-epimerase [Roseicyclus sp. F158]
MILVTGGAGFIGSNMLADLEAAGAGPLVLCDWLGTGEKWRNVSKRRIAEFVRPEDLPRWLEGRQGVEAVIHLGAISATTERDADLLIERNIRTTVRLWDWCTAARVPLLYASSAASYGARETDLADDEAPAALAALAPLNAYGWSKAATDRILLDRARAGEAPALWAGLRFFNVYGPNEYHKENMMSVVTRFFSPLSRGETVELFKSDRPGIADGQQSRDFVYVKDCTAAMLAMLERPVPSGLYNLGTGVARSFADLVAALGRALGREPEIRYIPLPVALEGRYQYRTEAQMAKLRRAGIDMPFRDIEAGVADYVETHLSTMDPYR